MHVNNKTGSHLPDVDEEREAREESAAEDRFFETYKQEMEKYFSCFEDEKRVKKKTKKAKGGADKMEEIDKKPNIVNIGSIRNQFENLATSEQPLAEAVEVANPRPKKKVGKLETTKLFEETKSQETKKKEYVPIVIDKDAFERTMCRFENYKDEEEERERRREEQKRKKLEDERLRMEQEREEEERRKREEEERKRKMKEEEAEAARKAEQENKKKSMLNKIGNFFSGKVNELKEASPVKEELSPAEKERLRRLDIQRQIQAELDKIRDLEEKRRIQIEKERKRNELKMMIQLELDKVKGLDKKQTESTDEMPLWMKMVADPEARKAYARSKLAQEKETASSIETKTSKEPQQGVEVMPKWVQMVMDRQDALEKAKEQMELAMDDGKSETEAEKLENVKQSLLDLSKICAKESDVDNDVAKKQFDNKPAMTFKESVQAMIDLLEEDKKFSKTEKSKLMTKKKENVMLKNVSAVRSQFENVDSSCITIPTTPVSPVEINSDKVKQTKMILMQQNEKSGDSKSKIDVLLTKKCSTIKSMFERSSDMTTTTFKEDATKPKPKKTIVQVVETPSIEQQLAERKRQLAETKWSYKEKSLRDLQQIFSNSESTAQLARKAESVLETSKMIEEEKSKRLEEEKQDLDVYNSLMEQIHEFVDNYDKCGKTDEEVAFRNTLGGYLKLIEDDDEYRKRQKGQDQTKKGKVEVKKINKKVKPDMFKQDDVPTPCNNKNKNVKKLDLSKFLSSEKDESSNCKKEMNKFNCEMIKEQLEKRNNTLPEVSNNPIHRKMKLVNIEEPISVTQALADLKSRREIEWKWKQKTIEDLQNFLQQNKTMTKSLVEQKTGNTETENRKKDLERILERRRQLKLSTDRRDEEFDTFMKDLELFSLEPSVNESDEIFKSSVKSYLALIETQKREEETDIELPEIVLPNRLDDLKNKIAENQKSNPTVKKPVATIKRIKSFFGKSESQEEKESPKAPVLGPGKASKLKKMFEERPKMSNMMRTMSELTLQDKPAKRTKHIIEPNLIQEPPMLSRRASSNRFAKVNKVLDEVPNYKKLEQKLNEVGAKSQWDDFQDPEERKKAILAKYGFKPADKKRMSANIDDVDTIPEHILKDEVLYR